MPNEQDLLAQVDIGDVNACDRYREDRSSNTEFEKDGKMKEEDGNRLRIYSVE